MGELLPTSLVPCDYGHPLSPKEMEEVAEGAVKNQFGTIQILSVYPAGLGWV